MKRPRSPLKSYVVFDMDYLVMALGLLLVIGAGLAFGLGFGLRLLGFQ